MKGQLALDVIIGLLSLTALLAFISESSDSIIHNIREAVGYVICQEAGEGLSNYYGLLRASGVDPPALYDYNVYGSEVVAVLQDRNLQITLKSEDMEMNCGWWVIG